MDIVTPLEFYRTAQQWYGLSYITLLIHPSNVAVRYTDPEGARRELPAPTVGDLLSRFYVLYGEEE